MASGLNEGDLAGTINALGALESARTRELQKIARTKTALQKILMDGGSMPVDEGTGRPMTPERRLEIYGICIAVADGLLADGS